MSKKLGARTGAVTRSGAGSRIALSGLAMLAASGLGHCRPLQDPKDGVPLAALEITGSVSEAGIQQPVDGALVLVFRMSDKAGAVTSAGLTEENALAATRTGYDGKFRFVVDQVGRYRVEAQKLGYADAARSLKPSTRSAEFALSKDQPAHQVALVLTRPSTVTGVLLDEETREPVASARVTAWQTFFLAGHQRLAPAGSAIPKEEGRFSIPVTPAEYLIGVRPKLSGPERLMKTFTKDDLAIVDTDYGQTYWPGGHSLDTALPTLVRSNDELNLGILLLRKIPLYRAHVKVLPQVCEAGQTIQLNINGDGGWTDALGVLPCGSDFLLRGLPEGSYKLDVALRGGEHTMQAVAIFQISDHNIEVIASLQRGVSVEGSIVPVEGSSAPSLENVRVLLRPIGGVMWAENVPVAADTEGRFRVENAQPRDLELILSGLPNGFYVKELRHNGSLLHGTILPIDNGATSQSIRIITDDKPATLDGSVSDGDRPASNAYVVLLPWPLPSPSEIWPIKSATSDKDGKYQFSGLRPGDYRVLAVPSGIKDDLENPEMLQRLISDAKAVTLAPSGYATVALPIAVPR